MTGLPARGQAKKTKASRLLGTRGLACRGSAPLGACYVPASMRGTEEQANFFAVLAKKELTRGK
jgi:hypothetical protein